MKGKYSALNTTKDILTLNSWSKDTEFIVGPGSPMKP